MGLFDTSATNARSAQAGVISPAQLARTVSATANQVSATANAVTGAVIGTVAGVEGAVVNTAKAVVGTVVNAAESVVANAVSGVATLFSSAEHAVAGAISSSFTNLFSNTNTASLADVNTVIPDPVASSFSGGTPKSTLFSTNPIYAQVDPVSFAGQVSSTTYAIPSAIQGSLTTLSTRFNQSVSYLATGLSSVATADIKTGYLSGLYSDLTSGVQAVSSVAQAVVTVSSDFQSLAGGVAQSLTGSSAGLNSFYNSLLPATASPSGGIIVGIPSGTSSSTLDAFVNGLTTLGCTPTATTGYGAYGAQQSLLGALLSLAAQLGINTLISDILGCPQAGPYTQTVATNMFYATAGSNAGTAYALSQAIIPGSLAVPPGLTGSIITNPSLKPADTASVLGILGNLKVNPSSTLGTGTTINGQSVWNSATVSQTPAWLVPSLTGGVNLAQIQGGQSVPLDVSDFGVAT